MVGAVAVGKTSLVEKFVRGIFSDRFLTTVGVKIDKKTVQVRGEEVELILWDLAGEDEFFQLRISYMRGASGYLLVADGTRRSTFDKALELNERILAQIGPLPFVMLLNKADLNDEWEVDESIMKGLADSGVTVIVTSAKTGQSVEEAFSILADRVLQKSGAAV